MRGPLPSYRPVFPSTFLEQAAKIAWQRTVPYQMRQRAALVLLLSQQPLVSNIEAAQRVQLHPRSVQPLAPPLGPGRRFPGRQAGTGPQGQFFPLWTTHWSRRSLVNWSRKPSNR